jgi:hypothetical protein
MKTAAAGLETFGRRVALAGADAGVGFWRESVEVSVVLALWAWSDGPGYAYSHQGEQTPLS